MAAEVRGYLPDDPEGIVLILHGGGEHGEYAITWWMPPVLRMIPFARAVRRHGGPSIGVLRMKNDIFGWNGSRRSPVGSTRWALERIREEHPDVPIVTVGHSMGGRVALDLAEEPGIVGVAALAPWIVEADGVHGRPGQRALLMHGLRDEITLPRLTQQYGEKMRERGVDVTWRPVVGEGHAMLSRAPAWHRAVAGFAVTTLKESAA